MTMRVGDSGGDVSTLQQKLSEAGYYSGSIDGNYGPDTEAAVRAYQEAHGLTVDGVAGAETWGNINGDPNFPNNSTGALGGGSSTGSTQADYEEIKRQYPQFAYLIDDPEIGPILREANQRSKTPNPMSASEFEAKITGSQWFRTTSSSARNYYNQQFVDPATFNNKVRDYADQVKAIGGQLGYDETILTPSYIDYFANKAYREGLSPAQMKALMANEITPLAGTTEKSVTLHQMREIQQQYQVAIDDPTRLYWLQAIGNGSQSIENFRGAVVAQAKALFPNLTGQFEQGMTLKQIIDPYRQLLSKEFDGADIEQFDFIGDPKWRQALTYVDPKDGKTRMMNMQEFQKHIRSQAEWRNTKNSKMQAAEIGEQLLRSFGQVA